MISVCRSQIYTLEKTSTKLHLSGSGWASGTYPDNCVMTTTTQLPEDAEVKIHRTGVFNTVMRIKSSFTASFPLLHLYFWGLEEGPVLLLLAFLAFGLEGPPTVHTAISCFLTNSSQNKFHLRNSKRQDSIYEWEESGRRRTSKFFCHSLSRFAFSAASISSSLALFLKNGRYIHDAVNECMLFCFYSSVWSTLMRKYDHLGFLIFASSVKTEHFLTNTRVEINCCLPFMHFLCFSFLPLDFELCEQLHGLFVHCLFELVKGKLCHQHWQCFKIN